MLLTNLFTIIFYLRLQRTYSPHLPDNLYLQFHLHQPHSPLNLVHPYHLTHIYPSSHPIKLPFIERRVLLYLRLIVFRFGF